MRAIKRYIEKNWLWIIVGLVLTRVFVRMAYMERGYIAFGGEWLILPLVLALVEVVRNIGSALLFLYEMEDDYDEY